MLRVTGLSLLLGLAALVAMLYIVYLPTGTEQPAAEALHWTPQSAVDGATPIALDEDGLASIAFSTASINAASYPYLHIALRANSSDTPPQSVMLRWHGGSDEESAREHTFETTSLESLWLATGEIRGWESNIRDLRLDLEGSPNQTLRLEELALYPATLKHQLRAVLSDLTAYVPWNRSSMNAHTGVRNTSSFYPTILFACLWLASLGIYVVLCLLVRRLRFLWEVAGLITLGAWVAQDITWQGQLIQQAANTRDTFAGKSTHEKLLVGPDATLYQFVDAAKHALPAEHARVFSVSTDDYTGLRGAYYLFPHNAFWSRDGGELPRRYFLRSGDYIALLNPNAVNFDQQQNVISLPRGDLRVETLVSLPGGTLVKVE